jgi:hypothetical protein
VTSQQSVRQAARRSALNAKPCCANNMPIVNAGSRRWRRSVDCANRSIWTAGLAEVDSGIPDNDVDTGRVVVLPHFGDLPERVGSHGDHILAAQAANIPQRGDLDLLARRHDGGIDDPQFPVDVGVAYAEPRGGLVGKGVPLVVHDGRQLGHIRGDLGAFISRAPMDVAYSDQTHDQVRQLSIGHPVSSPPIGGAEKAE